MKNNLAYNVICGIAKLGFNFQEMLAGTNNLEIEGPEISSLLEGKALKNFLDSKNCYIFTLDQLLVKEGDKLLSWQQIIFLKGSKAKGRTPSWFKSIEEKVLADSFSRKVREEYKTKDTNWAALKARKQRLSKDKRKKEWVITKENNIPIVGKIVKITEKRFIIEH